MAYIRWKIHEFPWRVKEKLQIWRCWLRMFYLTLFYNQFTSFSVALETVFEPIFCFLDRFARYMGPVFMTVVIFLTTSVVAIFYVCLLPHVYSYSIKRTIFHLIFGHWLLVNIVFNYVMAAFTYPGTPPLKNLPETVSICKKCIAPKPPRTHHCSICNLCILKMDHHCPWLNNCVGFYNHRYFFAFCCYMCAGAFYVSTVGYEVFAEHFYGTKPYMFPAAFYPLNMAYDVINKTILSPSSVSHVEGPVEVQYENHYYHVAVIYEFLVCSAVSFALFLLVLWHASMISKGETSIEVHINKKQREKFKKKGLKYRNPYNFGILDNWRVFLGIESGTNRSFFRHILFPSTHPPSGNGLSWPREIYVDSKVGLQLL